MSERELYFSDGTADYRIPPEPQPGEPVRIRFRAGTKPVAITLCLDGTNESRMMTEADREDGYVYYETQILLETDPVRYYFRIEDQEGENPLYYDRRGITQELRNDSFFAIVPGFSTPDWAKGAVMYQILTDRFCNGDETNDVLDREYYYIKTYASHVTNWRKYPASFGVAEFYGGDLAGVKKKLDYLEKLGIDVIYFNPLFVSPSNHKYDCQDYDAIDPHYGTIAADGGEPLSANDSDNQHATAYIRRVTDKRNLAASNALFIDLVREAHARGIRVILDGVFNHCGSFHKWMDRERIYEEQEEYESGAYVSKESPYRNYFHFSNESLWPYNDSYDGWWGHNTLPKLNYEESKELCENILAIAKKWVSPPFCADGWRLDVAADLGCSESFNHDFWRRFRQAVKEANPDALILAEHYGDPRAWLSGDQWDSIMNYDAFMEPITWFLTGMEKHSDSYRPDMLGNDGCFRDAMEHSMTRFLTPSLYCAMNELSNHDHSRFLTRTNHKVGRASTLGSEAAEEGTDRGVMKEAVVFQMTWPGAPTIYYGDEVGVCGFTDPDNRRTYPWGDEDRELLSFHREMIRIHKRYEALRTGSVRLLECQEYFLSFARFTRKEQLLILLNNGEFRRSMTIPVRPAGIPEDGKLLQVMYTTRESYSAAPVVYHAQNGLLDIDLPACCALVLWHGTEE